jgi:hypothetical protein
VISEKSATRAMVWASHNIRNFGMAGRNRGRRDNECSFGNAGEMESFAEFFAPIFPLRDRRIQVSSDGKRRVNPQKIGYGITCLGNAVEPDEAPDHRWISDAQFRLLSYCGKSDLQTVLIAAEPGVSVGKSE